MQEGTALPGVGLQIASGERWGLAMDSYARRELRRKSLIVERVVDRVQCFPPHFSFARVN